MEIARKTPGSGLEYFGLEFLRFEAFADPSGEYEKPATSRALNHLETRELLVLAAGT
jgi:hypothetical protein